MRFLQNELDTSKKEELWGGNVSTLYMFRGCLKVKEPFLYTELLKIGDEELINENFSYSYSICYAKKS